jgi:hypothetical protein
MLDVDDVITSVNFSVQYLPKLRAPVSLRKRTPQAGHLSSKEALLDGEWHRHELIAMARGAPPRPINRILVLFRAAYARNLDTTLRQFGDNDVQPAGVSVSERKGQDWGHDD